MIPEQLRDIEYERAELDIDPKLKEKFWEATRRKFGVVGCLTLRLQNLKIECKSGSSSETSREFDEEHVNFLE